MKNFIRGLFVMLVMSTAASAFAAPTAISFSPRISIALPTQQIDFSDLDMRDEFNRPIVATVVRERFEQQLTKELNRLLLQNLTPLRRAWLDLLDAAEHAANESLSQIFRRAYEVVVAVLRVNPVFSELELGRISVAVNAPANDRLGHDSDSFSLALQLVSTTRLLR